MQPIEAKIAALRQRLAGTPVTATEPVFGYMFAALGMTVRDMPFQMAVMNNTEPGASDVAAFENDLKTQIKKLQRTRDQIKSWITSPDWSGFAWPTVAGPGGASETPGKSFSA